MLRDFGAQDIIFLLFAARWTFVLAALGIGGGILLGSLACFCRLSPFRLVRWPAMGFIQVIQGTPFLVQILVAYYGPSLVGWRVDAWPAASAAIMVNSSAFFAEIARGGIDAVPKGNMEAGLALGLRPRQVLVLIVIPQALRLILPPSFVYMVQVIKQTSVAALIGVVELARAGMVINTVTFSPLIVFSTVSALYFCICWPLARFGQHLERRAVFPSNS